MIRPYHEQEMSYGHPSPAPMTSWHNHEFRTFSRGRIALRWDSTPRRLASSEARRHQMYSAALPVMTPFSRVQYTSVLSDSVPKPYLGMQQEVEPQTLEGLFPVLVDPTGQDGDEGLENHDTPSS